MSKVQVQITRSAKQYLKGIARWVMLQDSPSKAAELLRQLEEACNSLTSLPLRGYKLPEQEIIAYSDCLEIHQGPCYVSSKILNEVHQNNLLFVIG